jgi:LysM repeat protein
MTLFSVLNRLLLLATILLGISGCSPVAENSGDEERDPYYLAGKSRLSSMDYDGAFTAFENALNSNPKSSAAHLQLGLLCEEKKTNYAAAVYHLEKHLEFKPESNMAETVKQHILSCKMELARSVPFALVNQQVQDEIRKLNSTNIALRATIEQQKIELKEQAASFSNRLAQAIQAAQVAQAAATFPKPDPTPSPAEIERPPGPKPKPLSPVGSSPTLRPATPKTHLVRSGETLATIARRYNVRLSSLQAANPHVEARKLKAGQILTIPAGRS